jgi:hypothetical protein
MGKGHSPYLVYQVIKNRVIEKVIPSLGRKSNAQRNFAIAMVIISLLASIGIGIYLDGYVIHPPAQYTGICASPAHIVGPSCETSVSEVVTVGSTTETKVVQQPAGIVLLPNGTAANK